MNVSDLSGPQVARLAAILDTFGIRASPIGKIPVDADLAEYLARFDRVLAAADRARPACASRGTRRTSSSAGCARTPTATPCCGRTWRTSLKALRADGFDGFFSMEPHLAAAGDLGGFSGPALFATATSAVTALLRAAGGTFR